MVAEIDMGHNTRSLVQIPGSSAGKQDVSTVLMDFTHVSTLAAMCPVPTDLPACLVTGNSERNPPEFKIKGTDSPASSRQNLQPSAPPAGNTGSPSSASPPVGKRLYVVRRVQPMAAQKPYARPVTQSVRITPSARTVFVIVPPRNNNGPARLRAESVTQISVVTGSIRN
ncbi:uncharacterized protein LOC134786998 [Penaeus indicus]|uniref:uncharacterized protein LOC134786998 n=1 Tax=Penaeus indicus TaxID=29960 RepID=UPI00300C2A50